MVVVYECLSVNSELTESRLFTSRTNLCEKRKNTKFTAKAFWWTLEGDKFFVHRLARATKYPALF